MIEFPDPLRVVLSAQDLAAGLRTSPRGCPLSLAVGAALASLKIAGFRRSFDASVVPLRVAGLTRWRVVVWSRARCRADAKVLAEYDVGSVGGRWLSDYDIGSSRAPPPFTLRLRRSA